MDRIRKQAVLFLCALLLGAGVMADQSGFRADGERVLRVALWQKFFAGVNAADAMEATQVWVETWSRKGGLCSSAKTIFFSDMERCTAALIQGELDFAVMESRHYFEIEDQGLVEPMFTTRRGGAAGDEFLILVRDGSEIGSLGDLAGCEVNVPDSGYYDIARTWLDATLEEHGFPSAEEHFKMVVPCAKPNQIVLPVFFGKADTCLVTRSDFETMGELNPQVQRRLRVLCRSPRYVSLVICTSRSIEPEFLGRLTENVLHLDLDPRTQQILTLHRMDSVVQLKPGDLDSTRDLWESDR